MESGQNVSPPEEPLKKPGSPEDGNHSEESQLKVNFTVSQSPVSKLKALYNVRMEVG